MSSPDTGAQALVTEALVAQSIARSGKRGAQEVRQLTKKREPFKGSSSRMMHHDALSLKLARAQADDRERERTGRRRRLQKVDNRNKTLWEYDLSGRCESKRTISFWARVDQEVIARAAFRKKVDAWVAKEAAKLLDPREEDGDFEWSPRPKLEGSRMREANGLHGHLLQIVQHVRCRNCADCARMKQRLWAERAVVELKQAQRTWFATLTLSVEKHFLMEAKARKACRDKSLNWDELSQREQFAHVERQIAREVQLFIKRVRQASKATLRTLIVCEAHKSGRPHYHLFIHEQEGSRAVVARLLKQHWRGKGLGIDDFKLVDQNDAKAAGYVSKYIGKDARARVRASVRYGQRSVAIAKREISFQPSGKTPTHNETPASGVAGERSEREGFLATPSRVEIVALVPRCLCACCTKAASVGSAIGSEAGVQSGMIRDEHVAADQAAVDRGRVFDARSGP